MNAAEERILGTLIDLVSLQKQSLDRLTERVEAGFNSHSERIDRLETKLSEAMDRLVSVTERIAIVSVQNSQAIDRLEQAIERQNLEISGHLAVAQQQSNNIDRLVGVVDRLLAKN